MAYCDEPINDSEARFTASEWHGGQFTCLYALSSSGSLRLYPKEEIDTSDLRMEIEQITDESIRGSMLEWLDRKDAKHSFYCE